MKNKGFIILLALIASTISCDLDNPEEKKLPLKSFIDENNDSITYYSRNGILEGESKVYDRNGILKERFFYKNNRKDSLYFKYYDNSKIEEIIYYRNGLIDGKYQEFNKGGFLFRESFFEKNKIKTINQYYGYENSAQVFKRASYIYINDTLHPVGNLVYKYLKDTLHLTGKQEIDRLAIIASESSYYLIEDFSLEIMPSFPIGKEINLKFYYYQLFPDSKSDCYIIFGALNDNHNLIDTDSIVHEFDSDNILEYKFTPNKKGLCYLRGVIFEKNKGYIENSPEIPVYFNYYVY